MRTTSLWGVAAKWLVAGYRVTDLEKKSSLNLQSPTPLSVAGPLFISSLLFHLSRTLLGAGVSVFFVLFTLAFTTGQTSPGSLPFIRCFILFPNLSALFVSSYVKMKKFSSFQFSRLAISWPPWVRVWGWASYRFLPFTVFSLGLLFCFSCYIVHLRCTSEGGSLDV